MFEELVWRYYTITLHMEDLLQTAGLHNSLEFWFALTPLLHGTRLGSMYFSSSLMKNEEHSMLCHTKVEFVLLNLAFSPTFKNHIPW